MKTILNVDHCDISAAAEVAVNASKNFRKGIGPKQKVQFTIGKKRFEVHETAKGTIVVNYAN